MKEICEPWLDESHRLPAGIQTQTVTVKLGGVNDRVYFTKLFLVCLVPRNVSFLRIVSLCSATKALPCATSIVCYKYKLECIGEILPAERELNVHDPPGSLSQRRVPSQAHHINSSRREKASTPPKL